jgi:hypothetical protein
MIQAANALASEGVIPPGVEDPSLYRRRSGGIIFPRDVDAMAVTREREQRGIIPAQPVT